MLPTTNWPDEADWKDKTIIIPSIRILILELLKIDVIGYDYNYSVWLLFIPYQVLGISLSMCMRLLVSCSVDFWMFCSK